METLELTIKETKELMKWGSVEISRNGMDIVVEINRYLDNDYTITIINPYSKVILNKSL